jgi:hypothetical protein
MSTVNETVVGILISTHTVGSAFASSVVDTTLMRDLTGVQHGKAKLMK